MGNSARCDLCEREATVVKLRGVTGKTTPWMCRTCLDIANSAHLSHACNENWPEIQITTTHKRPVPKKKPDSSIQPKVPADGN